MSSAPPPLTARQEEILALIRLGKANKEIADELGIGLGTVKQHLVALFKRLGVTNRAMAASTGGGPMAAPAAGPAVDTQLELRSCCVLSLVSNDAAALQRHAAVASAAFDCALLASAGGADIIFGLQRVSEDDAVNAVELARAIGAAVAEAGATLAGGLEAGYLAASMLLGGGWSGEIVAGRLVAQARGLRQSCPQGRLNLGAAARGRIAMHLRAVVEDPAILPAQMDILGGVAALSGLAPPVPPTLVGRAAERAGIFRHLAELARGRGSILLIEGEAGMGKTALARTAAQPGIPWLEYRCAGAAPGAFRQAADGRWQDGHIGWDEVAALASRTGGAIALVDDIQSAGAREREALDGLVTATAEAPLLLLCTGRASHRMERLRALGEDHLVQLRRMPEADIRQLLAQHAGQAPAAAVLDELSELASGVPLFACQLGSFHAEGPQQGRLPNALVALVTARIDSLGLHRGLLRVAATGTTRLGAIASALGLPADDVAELAARAERAGVLRLKAGRWPSIEFTHPLVKAVLQFTLGGFGERPGESDLARATATVQQLA